jgi:BMFP domain-containing protein YqiC
MPKFDSKTLDDLAARIGKAVESSPVKDIEKTVKAMLANGLSRLDVVPRADFDTQAAVLAKTREKLEQLEARVAALEARDAQRFIIDRGDSCDAWLSWQRFARSPGARGRSRARAQRGGCSTTCRRAIRSARRSRGSRNAASPWDARSSTAAIGCFAPAPRSRGNRSRRSSTGQRAQCSRKLARQAR